MRILGIDPGLQLTGYACVEPGEEPTGVMTPQSFRLVEAGLLRLKPRATIAYRLAQLHDDLAQVIDEMSPGVMAVEKLFSHYRHVRTSILMGHARGVILFVGQSRGLAIEELAVTEVKRAITGNGHASKEQIQRSVMAQCNLPAPPSPPDVADAIAIALCAARRLVQASA